MPCTLPDVPKVKYADSHDPKNQFSAILKDGEYPFNYGGSNYNNKSGPYWKVKDGNELPGIRWNGSNAFVPSTCAGIYIHKGDTKRTDTTTNLDCGIAPNKSWSVGCLMIKGGTETFYKYIGTESGTIKIVRDIPTQ